MKRRMPRPCDTWAEQLAALHPADLTSAERAALAAHLATCPTCAAARADYQRMDMQIRRLPDPQPFDGLPPRLLELWAEEDRRAGSHRLVPLPRVPEVFMQTTTHSGAPSPAPAPLHHEHRTRRRLVSGITAIAAVLIIALAATALVVSHAGKSTITGAATQPPTPTPGNRGWLSVPGLTNLSVQPEIAPSNPQIVYEASIDLTTFRRSDDDGATWSNLPLPDGLTSPVDQALLVINPTNAQNIFLLVGASTYHTSAYASKDGGAHWNSMHLPNGAGLADLHITVQGSHLYLIAFDANQHSRLISSTDGGANWQFADGAVLAQGQEVCGFAAAPTGSTGFALAQVGSCSQPVGYGAINAFAAQARPGVEILRTDDAGAHWALAGVFPYQNPDTQSFMAVSSGGAQPTLFAAAGQGNAYTSVMSTDGGQTWQQVPSQGIPANATNDAFPAGTLSDGSVLRLVQTRQMGWAFYALKLGSQAWRQVTPSFADNPFDVVVQPSASGHDTLWVVTGAGNESFEVLRYTLR